MVGRAIGAPVVRRRRLRAAGLGLDVPWPLPGMRHRRIVCQVSVGVIRSGWCQNAARWPQYLRRSCRVRRAASAGSPNVLTIAVFPKNRTHTYCRAKDSPRSEAERKTGDRLA